MEDARLHAHEALRLKPDYDRARAFLAALQANSSSGVQEK
jgi:hypothetical protein